MNRKLKLSIGLSALFILAALLEFASLFFGIAVSSSWISVVILLNVLMIILSLVFLVLSEEKKQDKFIFPKLYVNFVLVFSLMSIVAHLGNSPHRVTLDYDGITIAVYDIGTPHYAFVEEKEILGFLSKKECVYISQESPKSSGWEKINENTMRIGNNEFQVPFEDAAKDCTKNGKLEPFVPTPGVITFYINLFS